MTAALLAALIAVESGGRDTAIGDAGHALGALQIHAAVVADVNQFTGSHYQWRQMTNRPIAVAVATAYLSHYGGKNASPEKLARIWNGGPQGHQRSSTLGYWAKVRAKMR